MPGKRATWQPRHMAPTSPGEMNIGRAIRLVRTLRAISFTDLVVTVKAEYIKAGRRPIGVDVEALGHLELSKYPVGTWFKDNSPRPPMLVAVVRVLGISTELLMALSDTGTHLYGQTTLEADDEALLVGREILAMVRAWDKEGAP